MRVFLVVVLVALFSWQIQANPYCDKSTSICHGLENHQPIICTPLLGDMGSLNLGPEKSFFVGRNDRTFIIPSFGSGSVVFREGRFNSWGSMPGVGTLTGGTWILVHTPEGYNFTCRITSVSETLPGFKGVSAGLPDGLGQF